MCIRDRALAERERQERLKADPVAAIPRRKRRIYDRPALDLDISDYDAWRSFDRIFGKTQSYVAPRVAKVLASPALVIKVFGRGNDPSRNRHATMEWDFEDDNLDVFLLYDYKATTRHWGPNLADYPYDNQSHIQPRKRRSRHPTYEEFWASNELHEFRFDCSRYADWRKFRKWFQEHLVQKANDKSFEERALEKYGPIEGWDNYDKEYQVKHKISVFSYTKDFWFSEKGEKLDPKNPYHQKIPIPQRLGEEYRISFEHVREQKAQIGKPKQNKDQAKGQAKDQAKDQAKEQSKEKAKE
eukprot:TRINITY_DN8011_c0_g1_i5.p1 TRINITY_DN8011_c0_g1~~TRINITY_DN8011_c0_g1_i5.p1  ORF type:complete len:299 (+),score=71.93 TRINITY_DN8011_c0_g1_i5:75-971(+)